MKIAELQLIAFGPFTDCHLDLSPGSHGLHVLYGPNEAGKSSTLRAISHFLYGFPARTTDDFQHPYKNLRIGGRLIHSDGSSLAIVRRKSQKLSLRCGQDQDPVADEELLAYLGDVDQDFFESMFGINHERLRKGGQDIAAGKGQLGQLLFAAGAGIVNLQQLQNNLQLETDALLKSTMRSGSIHQQLQNYLEHRQAVVTAQVTVETWKGCEQQWQAFLQRRNEIDEQLSLLNSQLSRLQRIQAASTAIDRWKSRTEKLQQLSQVPRLEEGFVKQANDLLLKLKTQQLQADAASSDLKKLNEQLHSLQVSQPILAAHEAIDALRDRVGGIRKSLTDRAGVEARRDMFEREVQEHMRELDRQPDLSTVEELRLPRDKTVKIQSLGNQLQLKIERLQAERKACEQLRLEIVSSEQRLTNRPVSNDLPSLRSAFRAIQQLGDVHGDWERTQAEGMNLQRQIDVALKKLPMFAGQLSDLECLAIPSPASLDRFENEFANANHLVQTLQKQLNEDEQKRDALATRLAELESGQAVPTQSDLERRRLVRQQGWRLVHTAWHSNTSDDGSQQEFMQQFPHAKDLADAYQQAVTEADRTADALRTDADRVAMKTKLQADLEQATSRQAKRLTELSAAKSARDCIDTRWRELWMPIGITPQSPEEMQTWLRQVSAITLQLQQLRDREAECERKSLTVANVHHRLQQLLAKMERGNSAPQRSATPVNADGYSISELTQRIDDRLNELTVHASRFEQWTAQLNDERTKYTAAQAQVAELEAEREKLQLEWSVEMQRLGLETSARPEQANSRLATLQDLFERFKEVDRFRSRLQHIDRDAQLFSADVAALCATIAPELQQLSAEAALSQLVQRLDQSRAAHREQIGLTQRITELSEKLSRADQGQKQATLELDEMLRQAKVGDYDQLGPAAELSRQRRECEQAIVELEDEIASFCSGMPLADFVIEVEQELAHEQSLELRLAQTEQQQQGLSEERDTILGHIRSAEIELSKFDGSGAAAEANAQCQSIAADLEEELQALAVRRVATILLKTAIERHREKNQGPILSRASQIFGQITLGQYSGLQAEYNERGEPVLAGLRNGARVLVEGMSDGTCDQLYLALRLASLEAWLTHHEPIPLIVDDILMNFDDARSVATLHVLAQLSHRTQVIFFTHHQHLVELASQHLSSTELFVTNIPSRA